MPINGMVFDTEHPAAINPKATPAIQEVHLAYAPDIDPPTIDQFHHPDTPLYTELDPDATCTVRPVPHVSNPESMTTALTTAVERYQDVMHRLETVDDWLDAVVDRYSNHFRKSEAEIRQWWDPVQSLEVDLATTATTVQQSITDAPETSVRLPVRDVLLVCGIGTDLELVDIHEDGEFLDEAALAGGQATAAASAKGRDWGQDQSQRTGRDGNSTEGDAPTGSPLNASAETRSSLRGVCAYYGWFTQLQALFERPTSAEYDRFRVAAPTLVDRLDGATVTLDTEPVVGEANRHWGS